jgi:hypothetical protein
MSRTRFAVCLLLASAGLGALSPRGAAAQPAPLGPETRVDTLGSRELTAPMLAAQPGGGFEIAWGYLSDTPPFVSARHFAADGRPTNAAEVPIGGQGPSAQVHSVTATPQGFDVLWQLGNWPQLPNYRRHLDLRGLRDPGTPVRLGGTAFTTLWAWQVRGNGFLAGWQTRARGGLPSGIAVQHLTTDTGRLTGPVLRLNSRPVYEDERPTLTALAGGGFLAAWNGVAIGPGSSTLYVLRARLFSPAGQPQGPDFDVNSIVQGPKDGLQSLKVAAAPGGGFAVAWWFYDGSTNAGTSYLRLFDAAGRPRGPETPGPAPKGVESMAFDGDGNLLVLWSEGQGGVSPNLEIQLFDPDGTPQGPAERVASAASGKFKRLTRGSVAWSGSTWTVTWLAQVGDYPIPSAIFVRRFAD